MITPYSRAGLLPPTTGSKLTHPNEQVTDEGYGNLQAKIVSRGSARALSRA